MKGKRMLIRPALTGLLILILAATAGCTTVASSPGQIELSATEFDFGTIPNTEPVSQVFQVRNVGQGWLEITGVSTSCGCTTAEIDSPRLAAGQTTDLTVTYDPRTHEGATGEFTRVVCLRSNDPDAPDVTLIIRVTVNARLGYEVECIVSHDAAKSETLHCVGSKKEASTRNRETTGYRIQRKRDFCCRQAEALMLQLLYWQWSR